LIRRIPKVIENLHPYSLQFLVQRSSTHCQLPEAKYKMASRPSPKSVPGQSGTISYNDQQPSPTSEKHSTIAPTPSSTDAPRDSSSLPPNPSSLPTAALDLATKIFNLARTGDTAALEAYISAGIPSTMTNGTGDTLLMLAAYHGHAETCSLLLEKGADANALNDRGQSPLAGAVFKGYEKVVKVLVEQGKADVEVGQPNAVECGLMFKRSDLLDIMGFTAEGERKA
jgi:ankyrin repeat protein